jgi:hypothetical protein
MKIRFSGAVAAVALSALVSVPLFAQVTVDAQVAERVVDRTPQNTGTSFPSDVGQVSVWTQVTGAEGTTIQHVWVYGELEFPVSLEIGGSPWRTWSTKQIPPEWAGDWEVEIRDGTGNVLETLSFTVG